MDDEAVEESAGTEPSAARRVRVALAGAGLVGQAGHAITLAEDRERFDFVAVVDPSASVRGTVAARFGVPTTAARLEDLDPATLDAVVVSVPDPAHRDVTVGALRAGLHVFCEKPIATTLDEADEMIAARGDRVLQIGYMKLHDPAVEQVVAVLERDRPEIVFLSVEVNDPDQVPFVDHLGLVTGQDVPAEIVAETRRRGARAVEDALGRAPVGGEARAFEAYLSALVHDVSLAHHLLATAGIDAPLPLAGAAHFDAGRGVFLAWDLPGGARAQLTHLNLPGVADYRERVTLYCRDRILELTFPSPYLRHHPTRLVERRSRGSGQESGLATTDHRVSYEEAFRNELRAFHASITAGVPVRASAEAAREDLRALLAALRLACDAEPAYAG